MSCTFFLQELSDKLQMDAVTWDYSGYGLNPLDKFERTVDGLNLSLKTVLDHMVTSGYKMSNIILWGYSLGTGPSTSLAGSICRNNEPTNSLMGLILFGAYSSIIDVVKDHAAPVADIFSERWNNKVAITTVKCPVLLMHGQSDGLISFKHSMKLKDACMNNGNTNVSLVLFPNVGHTQFSWTEAMKEVTRWMEKNSISH
jgi:pimeloyl-ACP methyl ester carboxylesterase